jgi:RNA recognition motif-containing protein
MGVLIVIFRIYRIFCINQIASMDMDDITPSDYTLWIRGLPKDFVASEVIEFFSRFGRKDGAPVDIVKLTRLYDIGDFVTSSRALKEYRDQLGLYELSVSAGLTVFGRKKGKLGPDKLRKRIAKLEARLA